MKPLLTSALALLVVAGPTQAQGDLALSAASVKAVPAGVAAVDPPRVSPRLVGALGSASATTRAEALHAILTLAYSTPEGADLQPALPALLAIAQEDPDARLRTLAVRAIEFSADERAMADLRRDAWKESDPEVQRLLFEVLVGHYGVDALRGDAGVADLARSLRSSSSP